MTMKRDLSFSNHSAHNEAENLEGKAALEKMREIVNQIRLCFFVTKPVSTGSSGARPMIVRQVDADGSIWFLSAIHSHKDQDLKHDAKVHLYFQDPNHMDFIEIAGHAKVSQDKEKIRELWEDRLSLWFSQGIQDPAISVIQVMPEIGHYWDTREKGFSGGVSLLVSSFLLQNANEKTAHGKLVMEHPH